MCFEVELVMGTLGSRGGGREGVFSVRIRQTAPNSATFGELSDRHGLGSYPRVLSSCQMACALMVMSGGGRTPQLEPMAGDSAAPVGQTARLKCTYNLDGKTKDI